MKFTQSLGIAASLLHLVNAGGFYPKGGKHSSHLSHGTDYKKTHSKRGLNARAPNLNPRHVAARNRANIHQILDKRNSEVAADPLCSDVTERLIKAPKKNIWDTLTTEETVAVTGFMFTDSGLNLTATLDSGTWDNTM